MEKRRKIRIYRISNWYPGLPGPTHKSKLLQHVGKGAKTHGLKEKFAGILFISSPLHLVSNNALFAGERLPRKTSLMQAAAAAAATTLKYITLCLTIFHLSFDVDRWIDCRWTEG